MTNASATSTALHSIEFSASKPVEEHDAIILVNKSPLLRSSLVMVSSALEDLITVPAVEMEEDPAPSLKYILEQSLGLELSCFVSRIHAIHTSSP